MSKISPLAWHFPFLWTAIISRQAYEKRLKISQISNFHQMNLSEESSKGLSYILRMLIIAKSWLFRG